jgi:MoxR-like ATPase
MSSGLTAINDRIREESAFIAPLKAEIAKVIIGQHALVDRLLIGLLGNGHVLLEGLPGLAKTLSVKTLSAALSTQFQRIQFTPDLLPADLVGTQIYNPKEGSFSTRRGPLFANIILADEVNRAPAKVQSALLEAMQERQVTIGQETFALPDPFLVLATQNPIEQEGTYPLPEAQVDPLYAQGARGLSQPGGRATHPRRHGHHRTHLAGQGGGGARHHSARPPGSG